MEWKPILKPPDSVNVDEIISVIESEIAIHDLRGKYEEALARALLARHNAMFAKRQREILVLQLTIECRRKIQEGNVKMDTRLIPKQRRV